MKDNGAILIKNKKVIRLIDELLDAKYREEGFMYNVNRVDILLEALQFYKGHKLFNNKKSHE